MYRHKVRRSRLPRAAALALVVVAYAATVTWASDITGPEAAASVRDAVVSAGSVASAQVQAAGSTAATSVRDAAREQPLTTLAIAGVMLLAFAGFSALRATRRRAPAVRRARLAARYLTTLL